MVVGYGASAAFGLSGISHHPLGPDALKQRGGWFIGWVLRHKLAGKGGFQDRLAKARATSEFGVTPGFEGGDLGENVFDLANYFFCLIKRRREEQLTHQFY